jgi:hypothetical protein
MRYVFLLLAALVLAAPAAAQQTANIQVGWNANPSTDSVITYLVMIDKGPGIAVPASTTCPPPAPNCVVVVPNVPMGTHTVVIYAVNDWGEAPGSEPVTFTIGLPTQVKGVTVSPAPNQAGRTLLRRP